MKILSLFSQVLSMSMTASVVILFVLAARLPLKRAPKICSYLLWAVVLFRLLCPVSFSSALSLFDHVEVPAAPSVVYGQLQPFPAASPAAPVPPQAVLSPLPALAESQPATPVDPLALTWLAGAALLLIRGVISLLRLRRKLTEAVSIGDRVYMADRIASPFVLGVFRPRIYLPSSLPEAEQGYILLHEQTHIRRGDHIFRLLAFAALAIHWFNPLVWLAFFLSGQDMEMSCDEAVMRRMGRDIRAEYSASLLRLATGRRFTPGTPLAFGEGDTKGRIRNVMRYKKPLLGVAAAALAAVAVLAVMLASDPPEEAEIPAGRVYQVEDILYDAPQYSFTFTRETAPQYLISDQNILMEGSSVLSQSPWSQMGTLAPATYSRTELYALFDPLYNHANEALDSVETIWQADAAQDGETGRFYLLMRTRSDDLLLAYCYSHEGDTWARWLFQLGDSDQSYAQVMIDAQKAAVQSAVTALEAARPDEMLWASQAVVGSTVVLLTSSTSPGMPEDFIRAVNAYILDPAENGYAITESYTSDAVAAVGFSAAVVRGSGLTVVFGRVSDRLWDFRIEGDDSVMDFQFVQAQAVCDGGTAITGLENNQPFMLVIPGLVEITDILFTGADGTVASYAYYCGGLPEEKSQSAPLSITDLFPNPHDQPVLEQAVDLNGDGQTETIRLTDLHYNGGDGGYQLQVLRNGQELPLPAAYTPDLGFPFRTEWDGDTLTICGGDMVLAALSGDELRAYCGDAGTLEALNSALAAPDSTPGDAVSGFAVIQRPGQTPILAVKTYLSVASAHWAQIGYGITYLQLDQADSWAVSYQFLPTAPISGGNAGPLSQTELQSLSALFTEVRVNGLLLSTYPDPRDVDLSLVFYNGAGFHNEVREEEIALLGEDAAFLDVQKITAAQAEEYLQTWLGIGLADVRKPLDDCDGWTYLEDYNAYYSVHSDASWDEVRVRGASRGSQGIITAVYTLENAGSVGTVVLREQGGRYLFLSNREGS